MSWSSRLKRKKMILEKDRINFFASLTVILTGALWGFYWLPVRRFHAVFGRLRVRPHGNRHPLIFPYTGVEYTDCPLCHETANAASAHSCYRSRPHRSCRDAQRGRSNTDPEGGRRVAGVDIGHSLVDSDNRDPGAIRCEAGSSSVHLRRRSVSCSGRARALSRALAFDPCPREHRSDHRLGACYWRRLVGAFHGRLNVGHTAPGTRPSGHFVDDRGDCRNSLGCNSRS